MDDKKVQNFEHFGTPASFLGGYGPTLGPKTDGADFLFWAQIWTYGPIDPNWPLIRKLNPYSFGTGYSYPY